MFEDEKRANGLTTGIACCAAIVVVVAIFLFVNNRKGDGDLFRDEPMTVPNYVGMLVSDIDASGFIFNITEGSDSDCRTGEVLSQSPLPGTACSLGDTIELVMNGQAEVPDMTDYDAQDAERLVRVLGLSPRIEEIYDDDVAKGHIIESDPAFGSKTDFRSQIILRVSKGPDPSYVKIPDLRGMKDEDAIRKMTELGLNPVLDFGDDDEVDPGCVISTRPDKDEKVLRNSSIVITINNSPDAKMVRVPDGLVGKRYSEVSTALREVGLTIGQVTWDDESREAKDTVILMSVTPGTEVEEGTVVTMTVSTGKGAPKKLTKTIELPKLTEAYELEIWRNGEMVESSIIVPNDTEPYKLAFEGTSGKDKVMMIISDMVYAQLTFNYDDEKVTLDSLNSNMFTASPSPSPSVSPIE